MPSSSATPSTPGRISRIASKPLKLAASAVKPLTRSSSPTRNSSSSSGTSPPTSTHLSTKKSRPSFSRRGSSGNDPLQVAKAARGPRKPLEGEEPAAWLRVRVVKGENLVAKDRSGTSDPFVSLLLPPSERQSTPHIKKTLNPTFPPDSSTFDFPLYLSMAGVIGGRGLEAVMWDKDMLGKEYMGELSVPMAEWFPSGTVSLWDEKLTPVTRNLISTRRRHHVTGTLSLQIGFLPPKDLSMEEGAKKMQTVYTSIREQGDAARGIAGVLGVPAHKGIGTIKLRSRRKSEQVTVGTLASTGSAILASMAGGHKMVPVAPAPEDDDDDLSLADDGLTDSSSDSDSDSPGEEDRHADVRDSPAPMSQEDEVRHTQAHAGQHTEKEVGDTALSTSPERRRLLHRASTNYFERKLSAGTSTEDATPLATPGIASGTTTPGGSRRPFFLRRNKGSTMTLGSTDSSGDKMDGVARTEKKVKKSKKQKRRDKDDFNFDAESNRDVLGIVVMEIKSASDLPKLKSTLRVTYDMDPFVVISFGKKVFRTRVIRHSLNPVWDEKLLFHVRRHESAFTMQFAVLDWDKVSGNDSVGGCVLPLNELLADAPQAGKDGLYSKDEDGKHDFKEFTLPILTEKDKPWEAKHSPKLTIRAKYEPYDALRQRFWRQYINQYDVDETGTMSFTELTAMLDSLGSTLTQRTIEGFFKASGKEIDGELTMEEVILHLEKEVNKPITEKAKVRPADLTTGTHTPSMIPEPQGDGMAMTGPANTMSSPVDPDELRDKILRSQPMQDNMPGNLRPVDDQAVPGIRLRKASMDAGDVPVMQNGSGVAGKLGKGDVATTGLSETVTPTFDPDPDHDASDDADIDDVDVDGDTSDQEVRERVINIRTCPLCHRPRLGKRSEQDIVTHLAICASSDWSRVDRIVTANYVTSSQAQRKFLTKLMNKVTIGNYKLGANSANILVQDRMTGQLQEEKMAVYVRLGIRVLYKGWRSSMEGARARRLLKSMSIKQGLKFDNPESAADILPFIAFHNLNVDEILDPLDSFKTFNEFFYRKLKPSARPVSDPEDPYRLVSCADCRMMAFATVDEATRIWIKGREFSVARLLGPAYESTWKKYDGGALGIFRLAPQDYHRFHSPVRGKIGKMTMIDGEYYTVNPQAIRTMLDVYGENVRKVVPVESEEFGTVMTVWVGAMMVGSIATTVEEGQTVDRTDELGYFAFGGSTIVCLFEKGVLEWDEDLVNNGQAAIETLVRMGMGIGRSTRASAGSEGSVGSGTAGSIKA